ncbi:b3e63012-eb2f-4fd8-b260-1621811d956b [Sclerotinia trifoliorum]|uniref:B3e63012-eb2f-4fd8-b260-1621811d956b n=1 Tax=Sclerotinia trifoliorum TaxID=28548 RepID=A0A8H2VW24_9HELO|nr:b3e63012-eb2f-4fd8-b260-1621811d956b [Sclerotinia trifoliorum]
MKSEEVLPPTSPIEVTFGFELEFAIASVPDQYLDPKPNDPRQAHGITRPSDYPNEFLPYICPPTIVEDDEEQEDWGPEWYVQLHALQEGIAKVLTENGLPAIAEFEHEDPSKSENPQIKDLNLWVISMDRTITHGFGDPENINYYWWPIEIQSPAYAYNEENKLKRRYSRSYRLAMVEGMYVEKLIEEEREEEIQGIKDNYVIDTIMEQVSVDRLVIMLSSPFLNENRLTKRLTYSICNLETNKEKVKKTIEYRQHKSTLDDEEVYHWITVCRTIVHFASTVDEDLLKEFCKEHLHDTVDEFTIVEVLMAISLPAQAYYYGMRVRAEKT